MHSSLLNTMTAFVDDCVILLNSTLPFKYCPRGVINDFISGKYVTIGSNNVVLSLIVRKETKSIFRTFSNEYEHFIRVPFFDNSTVTESTSATEKQNNINTTFIDLAFVVKKMYVKPLQQGL